jgi:hypothetical protein
MDRSHSEEISNWKVQRQKKEKKNMLLLETIKINLIQQIEHGDVHLLLSLEELYALIDAFVFYMLVLSFSIQQNPQETQENHKKIIAIQSVNVWRKRFKYILSEYYVDTTIS